MSENPVYRQRKPIDPSEIPSKSPMPMESPEAIAQFQQGFEKAQPKMNPVFNAPPGIEVVPRGNNNPMAQFPSMPSPMSPMSPQMEMPSQPMRAGEQFVSNVIDNQTQILTELIAGARTNNYEPVNLPSKGKFYTTDDTPKNGVIHLRPMTGEDERYLATERFVKKNQAMTAILRNCINEKKIDINKLLVADKTYLLVYLRAISYGNIYDVSVPCRECGRTFEQSIDLDKLQVKYCDDDFTEENLSAQLPISKYFFTYRLPNSADELRVTEHREHMLRNFPDYLEDGFLFKASLLLNNIGNGSLQLNTFETVKRLLQNLSAGDVNYIRNVINKDHFGVNTEIEFSCPACFHDFSGELPFSVDFFFPRLKEVKTE